MTKKGRSGPAPKVMPKRTTLKALAEYLNLSQTTVSFVMNDAPLAKALTEDTRRRVLEAAKTLNYRPSYFALNLDKLGSSSVGVIVPEYSEGFFTIVMKGVERCLLKNDFVYFTACHYWQPPLMERYQKLMESRGAEGLLLVNADANFETRLPVVAIAAHKEKPGVTNIAVDHVAAARLAIKYLYQLGHRKIAFMKGHRHVVDTVWRWDAMMKVAAEFGVAPRPGLTTQLRTSGWSPNVGYEPTNELLKSTRDFTALMCFNDTSAIGAIRALHEAGMMVPRDVSVVGFDNIVGAEFHVPSLTTIQQPLDRMGNMGAQILLDRIANPGKQYEPTILVKPKLIVRESTALRRGR